MPTTPVGSPRLNGLQVSSGSAASRRQTASRAHPGSKTKLAALIPVGPAERARIRILVVDDEQAVRESCATVLRMEGYHVAASGRGDEALETLNRRSFDIVLTDLFMSQVDGSTLMRSALAANPATLVIVMTGSPSIESSIDALRQGAWDYLPKPFSAAHLQVLVGRAAHTVLMGQEAREDAASRSEAAPSAYRLALLGANPAFRRAIDLATKVASTDASVFITGESGSGKELIAQYIHEHSRRSNRPFVAVNCAALPENLVESELFGHRKGAFTGAVRDKPGLLEMANGGTLFLDELMELPKPAQAKLLRVIEDGVVRRVGSEETDAVVNLRFIAATNGDSDAAVRIGTLREDLYYRLCVVPIKLPPLRDRSEDIPLLAEFFLAKFWRSRREDGVEQPHLSEAALRKLSAHPWPGNVRELQNVIEHLAVVAEPGARLGPEDLPLTVQPPWNGIADGASAHATPLEELYHPARERVIGQFETQYLTRLITRAAGNLSEAARLADIDRTTLYRLMERHGLHRRPNAGWTIDRARAERSPRAGAEEQSA